MIYYSNQERCMTSVFGLARIEKILRCKLNIFLVDFSLSKLELFLSFRLLFVSYTNREGILRKDKLLDESDIKPIPISRNLPSIFAKYPHYDE